MATVVTHTDATTDIRQNAGWMSRTRSSRSADRWLISIEDAILSLANNPERYPEADEAADLGIDLRYKMHGRRPHIFRILFTIDGETVTVHRVRHAAQASITVDDL